MQEKKAQKTTFTIDVFVLDALKKEAIRCNRSMTQQAEFLLRRALFPADDRLARVLQTTDRVKHEQ
jgi:hypothetical protein